MENFNLRELWALWQRGKSINKAIEDFLDCPAIKKEIKRKLKKSNIISEIKNTGILGEREKQQQNILIFSEYEKEIFRQLAEKIKSEKLLAIGYLEPVGGSDNVDLIPRNYWPAKEISLEYSSINFEKGEFSNIRIIENPKHDIDFSSYDTESSPRGRTTLEEELNQAYDFLIEKGQIDFKKDFKSQIARIRKAIFNIFSDKFEGKNYSDKRKNLSDKTIQKHLSARFQREKKAHKAKISK